MAGSSLTSLTDLEMMMTDKKEDEKKNDQPWFTNTAGSVGFPSALGLGSSNVMTDTNAINAANAAFAAVNNNTAQQHHHHHHLNNNNPQSIDTNILLQVAAAQAHHLQQQQHQQQLLFQQQAAALLAASTSQHHHHHPQQLLHQPVPHNLIPAHLQSSSLAPSFNGTPGYSPAVIPSPPSLLQQPQSSLFPMGGQTVQDRLPLLTPVYNGVNPNYPGLRVLNSNPPIFAVDNFLTPLECQFLVTVASDSFGPAPVVGKGAGEVSASRTSSTCYLAREDLPDYMRKVSMLTGKPIEHCELPQVGRYLPSQQYLQHFDAFDTSNEDGRRFASNGGQRTITVLVYLNDVPRGGATRFPSIGLDVQPKQGMALVFFPATVDGFLDKMALHAAMPAVDAKFVSQVWIRQHTYNGQPSKRLPQTMGPPIVPPIGSTHPPQPIPLPPNVAVAVASAPVSGGVPNKDTNPTNQNGGSVFPNADTTFSAPPNHQNFPTYP